MEILARYGVIFEITPDYSWLGLMLTVGGIWLIIELLRLPWWLKLIVFGMVLLDASSDMFHLYSRFDNWDRLLHFLGGAVAGLVAARVVHDLVRKDWLAFKKVTLGIFALAVLMAAFAGVLYEFQEYMTDVHYLHYQKQLGDGPDTVDDEMLNIYGAIVTTGVYSLILYKKRDPYHLETRN